MKKICFLIITAIFGLLLSGHPQERALGFNDSKGPTSTIGQKADNVKEIGCDYEWSFTECDTIPLVGYATGIPQKLDLGDGQILEGFYVCGLRYSKVKPYDWKEKYGLSDYLYFEAISVKEMNYEF